MIFGAESKSLSFQHTSGQDNMANPHSVQSIVAGWSLVKVVLSKPYAPLSEFPMNSVCLRLWAT